MRESISIRLPEDTMEALDRLAETDGVTRSDVVRNALTDYMFVRRLRKLRSRLLPFAEAHGVYTDEDVFRNVS